MDEAPQTRKPANTAFKQQRLKSWQPLLTPKTVIPTFFVIGLIFVPIGVTLYLASKDVTQLQFDYSTCSTSASTTFAAPSDSSLGISKWKYDPATRVCSIQFEVPTDIRTPVFMYYRLTNFYQNNRRYVKSFDLKQLGGAAEWPVPDKSLENCDPLRNAPANTTVVVDGQTVNVLPGAVYYPCGLIANSLFSDKIGNLTCVNSNFNFPNNAQCNAASNTTYEYAFSQKDIAWPADADRFGMTEWVNQPDWQRKIVPPPFWRTAFPEFANGYNATNIPNLKSWQALQVWMRTAGLPTFRKLWGSNTANVLPQGTWQVNIVQSTPI